MKTLTKTLFASALTAIFLTSAAMTTYASGNNKKPLEAPAAITFNKIKVSGNVKLFIVQSNKEKIEVLNGNYDPEKTSIQRLGYKLIINSTEFSPVTIVVSISDLQRIDASDNVVVNTNGKLNIKYLQVFLKDNAKANIKADTESSYVYTKDHSRLKLSGSSADFFLAKDEISKLDMKDFAAAKTTLTPFNEVMVATNMK